MGKHEHAVRQALTLALPPAGRFVEEFWIPGGGCRADLVAVSIGQMDAYEIKTSGDTLKRLASQVHWYGAVFTRCTLAAASRHLPAAMEMLPVWWGVVEVGDTLECIPRRVPWENPSPDPRLLVKLLWRKECEEALRAQGVIVRKTDDMGDLRRALRRAYDTRGLQHVVARAMLTRRNDDARIKTKRYAPVPVAR